MTARPGLELRHVLMPSRLFRRHICQVSAPYSFQGGTWWDLVRLCDGESRRCSTSFLEDFCAELADLEDPQVCPDCRSVYRPTAPPEADDGLDEYGTPPFDLFNQAEEGQS